MAKDFSFDIVSEVDLQEIDNAINQTIKEMRNRYDLKGTKCDVSFNREEKKIALLADSDLHQKSLTEMIHTRLAKRGVPIKALKYGEPEKAFDGLIRQTAEIVSGIPQDISKGIVKKIKDLKLKVQASIQGEKVRVSGRSKDELQEVVQLLKANPASIPLQFVNYR